MSAERCICGGPEGDCGCVFEYIDAINQRRKTKDCPALPPASAWQPIETAPMDTMILVGPTKKMDICVAMNSSRDGWVTESCSDWHNIYTPTHWMPLPESPK